MDLFLSESCKPVTVYPAAILVYSIRCCVRRELICGNCWGPGVFEQRYDEVLDCITSFQERFPCEGINKVLVLRNRYVFHSGDPARGLYLIIDGLVKVLKVTRGGGEKVIQIAAPGEFLGEVPVLLDKTYDITAQAASDAILLHIPEQAFGALLRESPLVFRRLLGGMARKVHCLIQDMESTFKAGHERVADYLLSHASEEAMKDEALSIVLPIKKTDIASRLGLTPQHFSRILQDLRQKGLIVVDGYVIHVPSVENLKNGWLRFGQGESVLHMAS